MTCPTLSFRPMAAISRSVYPRARRTVRCLPHQVEYAVKAVENGGTAIGIRCKDGIVLALEKLITSKLLKSGANKRIATVDRNMGIVSMLCGGVWDALCAMNTV
jgi:20S proteasome alpha/beta subunit